MKRTTPLGIRSIRCLEGPNVHAYQPVLEMLLEVGHLDNVPTTRLGTFNSRLLQSLPSLSLHQCTRGRPGGLVERLHEGTLVGHVIEHVALELQSLAGFPVFYGKTRGHASGVYSVVVEYQCRQAATYALRAAVELAATLLEGRTPEVVPHVDAMVRLAAYFDLGPSTRALAEAARRRGIPSFRLNQHNLVQLGYGAAQQRIQGTITQRTSCIAVDIAADKEMTRVLLDQHGLPVPPGGLVTTEAAAVALACSLGGPVVVKPCDSNQGKGVSLQVHGVRAVRKAFRWARAYSERVIVERFVGGDNFRLLVVAGQVVAASRRIPAHVVGDGQSTIAELVRRTNEDPRRGLGHERPLTRLSLDVQSLGVLKRQQLGLEDVLAARRVAYLRWNANLSTGGVAHDATDDICPENAQLAICAAQLVGLDVAGVDMIAQDPGVDISGGSGAIIELNAAPGIRMHHFPCQGRAREAAESIVNYLFPAGNTGRIPLVAVTGTNGKTTVTRLVGHMGQRWGKLTGYACSDGVYLDGQRLLAADASGPRSARMLLENPRVELAVLETARGGIIRSGLGFDACDVAVITNLQDDHVEQDGIASLEALREVKGLLVEVVRRQGAGVFNADDPLVASLAERCPGEVIFFGLTPESPCIAMHLRTGGRALYCRDQMICLAEGSWELPLLPVSSIPCTFRGRYSPNVANALAALGAGWALGIPTPILVQALGTFQPDAQHNPGRLTLLEVQGRRLCVDYAHNPPAVMALAQFSRELGLGQGRCIGVVAAPGDRSDASLERFGRALAQGFDRLFIKEDVDLRGRAPGETAHRIQRGVLDAQPRLPVDVVLDEKMALEMALQCSKPEDVIVVLYEKYEYTMEALKRLMDPGEPRSHSQQLAGKASQV